MSVKAALKTNNRPLSLLFPMGTSPLLGKATGKFIWPIEGKIVLYNSGEPAAGARWRGQPTTRRGVVHRHSDDGRGAGLVDTYQIT